jgi:2-haloacid dehalogenase
MSLSGVTELTFDVFGTVLDLAGSLTPFLDDFLAERGSPMTGMELWNRIRGRQRIEQYQDNLLMLGHTGYHAAVRRAFSFILKLNGIPFQEEDVDDFIKEWKMLKPFPDVHGNLTRLGEKYRLVILSNGEKWYLEHLAENRIRYQFDEIISVESVQRFKPHPAVYRGCAKKLGREPHQLMMVSSNSFDVMGARACGYNAAWVKRQEVPYQESPYRPTITVASFKELTEKLTE